MPKVSVVIPVYNTSKYLRQCLDSLLNQTLEDFEVICVNDGSTDNSLVILKEYAQKDSRFIVIDKENEGQGIARNIAIEKAQGEYLLCLDSDDWLENNALELVYNSIIKDDIDILFFDVYRYIEKTGKKYIFKNTEVFKNFRKKPFSQKEVGKVYFMNNALPFKLYKTSFIKNNNIKYSNHKFMEDAPFFIKAMFYAKKIFCLSTPIYNYRVSSKSTSHHYKKYLQCMPEVYDICFKIAESFQENENIFNSFLCNRMNSMLTFYACTPLYKKATYYKMMKKIINKHFSKYNLDEKLVEINNKNVFEYEWSNRVKKTKYIIESNI